MNIRKIETDASKSFQGAEEALVDLGFVEKGKAVITTNDGHEVKAIFEKDAETVYILHADHSNTTYYGVIICTVEDVSEYQLVEE